MAEFWIPDESSGEIITAPQLEARIDNLLRATQVAEGS